MNHMCDLVTPDELQQALGIGEASFSQDHPQGVVLQNTMPANGHRLIVNNDRQDPLLDQLSQHPGPDKAAATSDERDSHFTSPR